MGLISAAYPERGWHLSRHLSNVLEARASAGEAAALAYDQAFRKTPSNNAPTRRGLKLHNAWPVEVGSHVHSSGDTPKRSRNYKVYSGAICWEFNPKGCRRRRCCFYHVCKTCGGGHAKSECPRTGGGLQPFQGSRSINKKEGGGSGATNPSSMSKTSGFDLRQPVQFGRFPHQAGSPYHRTRGYPL